MSIQQLFLIKDRTYKLIGRYTNTIDRWEEYFEEFLNRQTIDEREIQFRNDDLDINEGNCEPSSSDEIRDDNAKIKYGRISK